MFLHSDRASASFRFNFLHVACAIPLLLLSLSTLYAQGGVDYTGTGGKHTIQGRIFFSSGRRADSTSIKVTLESITTGNLTVFADSYGSFTFKNLTGGSYTVVIEGNQYYESVREPVTIEDTGGRYVRSVPGIVSVQIFLQPRRSGDSKPAVLNAALANVPKDAAELYTKGFSAAQAGDTKKAIEYFNGALKIYPEFPLALNELGMLYMNLKETDKAVELLRAAAKYAPDDFTIRLNYGTALLAKNDVAESENQLRAALKQNDASWSAHMYLGFARMKQKDYDEAERELLRSLAVGGQDLSLPHKYLGGIYWGRRDYKRAADELEKYLKLSPKAADAEQTRNAIKELRHKQ